MAKVEKISTWANRLVRAKPGPLRLNFPHFTQFRSKWHVDNISDIWYVYFFCRYLDENGHFITKGTTYWIYPTIVHKPKFQLNPLSKSKFLSKKIESNQASCAVGIRCQIPKNIRLSSESLSITNYPRSGITHVFQQSMLSTNPAWIKA